MTTQANGSAVANAGLGSDEIMLRGGVKCTRRDVELLICAYLCSDIEVDYDKMARFSGLDNAISAKAAHHDLIANYLVPIFIARGQAAELPLAWITMYKAAGNEEDADTAAAWAIKDADATAAVQAKDNGQSVNE